jgi:transglutaminase-like putative cysteine protease
MKMTPTPNRARAMQGITKAKLQFLPDWDDPALMTRETLKVMRELTLIGVHDPAMRLRALNIVADIPGKAWRWEIRRMLNWVRRNITYRLDATEVEQLCLGQRTLELGQGDCDDMSILLATLLMCIGHPCRFVAMGFGEPGDGEFSHVMVETLAAGDGPWISLDATEPEPMGWFPPGVTNIMLCPIGDMAA